MSEIDLNKILNFSQMFILFVSMRVTGSSLTIGVLHNSTLD